MTDQIEEFETRLARSGQTAGSCYQKVDFHIHMPGSSDYEYAGEDALDLMAQQITESGLRIATIVKHQEFPTMQELSTLQAKCKSTQLLPGAELNLFVDALGKKVGKDYFYHCLVIGDPDSNFDSKGLR